MKLFHIIKSFFFFPLPFQSDQNDFLSCVHDLKSGGKKLFCQSCKIKGRNTLEKHNSQEYIYIYIFTFSQMETNYKNEQCFFPNQITGHEHRRENDFDQIIRKMDHQIE